MQSKILSKRILLIIVLAGFTLSLATLFYFIQSPIWSGSAVSNENVITFLKQEQASSGLPVRLKIPKINVDASIEHVGVTSDGAMGVPKDPTGVAWFKFGPHPGETGSAVIAGHYGFWQNGKGSVFDDLSELKKGDVLSVEDEKGVITTFVVRESRRYDPKADASDVFGSSDGKAHLNLITCEGTWNKIQQSYSNRLVVFTDKKLE